MLGADVGEYVLGSTFPLVLILSLTSQRLSFYIFPLYSILWT